MMDADTAYPYNINGRPKTGSIRCSNDNINWTTVATYTNPNITGIAWYEWDIPIVTNNYYKYIRIFVDESYNHTTAGRYSYVNIPRIYISGITK